MSPIEDDGQIEYLDNLKRKEIKIEGQVDAMSLPMFAAQKLPVQAKNIRLVYRERNEKEVKISFPIPSNSGFDKASCNCSLKMKKLEKQNDALEAENANLSRTLAIWKSKYQFLQSKKEKVANCEKRSSSVVSVLKASDNLKQIETLYI